MKKTLVISDNEVEKYARLICNAFKNGNKLLVAGNGGSASDAQHFVGELVCTFKDKFRKGLPAICLNCNTSVITAWSNDMCYSDIFARQIQALGKRGDIFIGISTSGKSPNIVHAIDIAADMGLIPLLLTRNKVTGKETDTIQEHHIYFIHQVCKRIEEMMK